MTEEEAAQLVPGDIIYYKTGVDVREKWDNKKMYGIFIKYLTEEEGFYTSEIWAHWASEPDSHDYDLSSKGWVSVSEAFLDKPVCLIETLEEYKGIFE